MKSAANHNDLEDEQDSEQATTNQCRVVGLFAFLCLDVHQHDDEKEQHHHRPGVNQDLDDPDEVCVKTDEQRGQANEARCEGEGAGDRVACHYHQQAEA